MTRDKSENNEKRKTAKENLFGVRTKAKHQLVTTDVKKSSVEAYDE